MSVFALKSAAFASAAMFALLDTPQALAQAEKETAQLEVVVSGLRAETGSVWVGVYTSEADWEAQKEHAAGQFEVADGQVVAHFETVQAGALGVQVFHDANSNGDFDKNMLGIPRERYGFSNNPFPRMRGASWAEAAFTVEPDTISTVTIELQGAF